MRHGSNIRMVCAGALLVLLLGCTPLSTGQRSGPAPPGPWNAANQLLNAVESDVRSQDILGVRDHRQAIEDALAEGAKAFPLQPTNDGAIILLTDGSTETRAALAAAGSQKTVIVDNPYPSLAFYLGTFYNNSGRPLDALRVLSVGFKLTSGTQNLGEQLPNLYGETGFSLEILKEWEKGLEMCRSGLSLPSVDRLNRARLYRCSGYCLNELGRYDEAETAYRAAIGADPEDKMARIELEFVLRHRATAR